MQNHLDILYTHPLHGEQLYLIILALEKFLNILENSNGSLQIPGGSLANYTTDNYILIRSLNKCPESRNQLQRCYLQLNRRSSTGTSETRTSVAQRLCRRLCSSVRSCYTNLKRSTTRNQNADQSRVQRFEIPKVKLYLFHINTRAESPSGQRPDLRHHWRTSRHYWSDTRERNVLVWVTANQCWAYYIRPHSRR